MLYKRETTEYHSDDLKLLQKLLHWSLKAGSNEAFVWDL